MSGNPGGLTADERDKIGRVRRYAQNRSFKSVKALERLLGDDNGKVVATAALGILKVAGLFNDDASIEAKVERRLKDMLEAAERRVPALAAVE